MRSAIAAHSVGFWILIERIFLNEWNWQLARVIFATLRNSNAEHKQQVGVHMEAEEVRLTLRV